MIVEDRFKTFITDQMNKLSEYDALRPEGHAYEFHVHSERVANLMRILAAEIGYDEHMAEALYWATRLHDIGKTALPVHIWDKKDKPTDEERSLRRTHTTLGVEIIRSHFGKECDTNPFLRLILDIAQNHHEAMDGSGFLGKTGNQLSREVKMACICDAFDGWSTRRAHFDDERKTDPATVINRMKTEKYGQFDPELIQPFEKVVLCQSNSSLLSPSYSS